MSVVSTSLTDYGQEICVKFGLVFRFYDFWIFCFIFSLKKQDLLDYINTYIRVQVGLITNLHSHYKIFHSQLLIQVIGY